MGGKNGNGNAARFVEALRRLEEQGDVEALVALHRDDAKVSNPNDAEPHRGREGARRFWQTYRDAFQAVRSEFRHAVETDGAALLEWQSRVRTAAGHDLAYDGVSVVEFDGGGIRRFRAYFDSTKLRESR